MKISILSTYDTFGGASISGMRLNTAFKKLGINSTMIVQSKSSNSENISTISTSWIRQKITFLRFVLDRLQFWFYEKSREVRFGFSQGTIGINLSKNKHLVHSDIIHLFWINFGFLSLRSLEKIGELQKPVIWNLQDMWAFTGGCHYAGECENFIATCGNCSSFLKNPSEKDFSNIVWKRKKDIYKNLNLTIVSSSAWLANEARKSSLFKNLPIYVIPTPIDTSIFSPIDRDLVCAQFNLSTSKKYILFASVKISDLRKGFLYFKNAMQILSENYSKQNSIKNIEILIFGNAIKTDFEDLPFKTNILGKLSDVNKIAMAYSVASVFVIPSLEDNLPNTIIESLACGTPVVGFNVGGIPEMIIHEKTGYVAEYKNSSDLAKGINYVLNNSKNELLNKNAREFALENYSETNVVKKYKELYQSLINFEE